MEHKKWLNQASTLAEDLVKKPLSIKSEKGKVEKKVKNILTTLFEEDSSITRKKLYVNGLDSNQIWAQISKSDHQINSKIQKSLKNLLKTDIDDIQLLPDEEEVDKDTDVDYEEQNDAVENGDEEGEVGEGEDIDEEDGDNKDKFFTMKAMQKFMNDAEQSEDEGLNLEEEEDILEEDEELGQLNDAPKDIKYDDLYGDENEENDEEENDEQLEDALFSQAREAQEMGEEHEEDAQYLNEDMKDQIEELEKKMVGPKSWQLTGEVSAKQRPLNSLLEDHFDFNTATKAAPVISETETNDLEQTIKQRILDEIFDDPIRKRPQEQKKKIDLNELMDFEKSQKGLAELYEDDYTKNVLNYIRNPTEEIIKDEIEEISKDLFNRLDSLANFHYTPRIVEKELKIQSNLPAFKIEERVPFTSSEAGAKTALEMFSKKDVALVERNEMMRDEKRQERNKKKRSIKNHLKKKLIAIKERNREHTGIQMAKFESKQIAKTKKDGKTDDKQGNNNKRVKSSEFFSKIQELAHNDVKKRKDRAEEATKDHSSRKYKL